MRRSSAGRRAAVVLVALVAVAAAMWPSSRETVVVAPGEDVGEVARANPGAVLELAVGRHDPFALTERVEVRGRPGATVAGGVEVAADDVRLVDLDVRGGRGGILVREVDGVVLEGVSVHGAELHGIEVVDASATIRDCRVSGLVSPYAQGIEVRNANGRPRTRVEGCTLVGGQEGFVSHVSRVEVRDTTVTGTTRRGIAITEMSEGVAERNRISDVAGSGLFCGDMSHCELRSNRVDGVVGDDSGALSGSGYGAVAAYHSRMRVSDHHVTDAAAGAVGVYTGSRLTERFPLTVWPAGWQGALPAVPVAALAVAGLGLLRLLAGRALASARLTRTRRSIGPASRVAAVAVLGGFVVQSFHMVEHLVQVWQVYVAEGPDRSGIAGAALDTEWVHAAFNAAVLLFLVQVWALGRREGWLAGATGAPAWLLAATVLQVAHLAEHGVKVFQHVQRGFPVGPGVVGQAVDLVWLHFGVNLAVYVGTAVAVGALARSLLTRRPARSGVVWARLPS